MTKGFTNDKTKDKYNCINCGLWENSDCYKMPPQGNFKKRILNLGEAPGKAENEANKQWQGKVGRILKRTYRRLGIDLFEDCVNVNSVNCMPSGNKKPTKKQIACCRNVIVEDTIREYEPDLIMLFGTAALESFIGHRWGANLGGANKWRGYCIPDRDYKAWVCPVFHPSYIARMDEEVYSIWWWDLERALSKLSEKFPKVKKPDIEFIDDLSVLYDIESDLTAFDFETTGLKPHAKGQRIATAAIADTPDHAYVFEMPSKRKDQKPFLDYLKNPKIGKVAANAKFEHLWALERLNVEVRGWQFDTMLAAHLLDNRTGVTSLDFQTYVNYGIIDYSSKVKPYIKPSDSTGNSKNKILELMSTEKGREELMRYNGYDVIYELRIAWDQIQEIDYDFLPII